MSTVTGALSSGLSTLAYPRTGKRGVPQQFARRLHEMIESEAKVALVYPDQSIISWSKSGLAFRIIDVEGFTSTVLPKYFRTKKFSSFQRNLNLYDFSKLRRGPDTDMYAHPSFMRGRPELLSSIRKCPSASRRKKMSAAVISDDSSSDSSSSSITGNHRTSSGEKAITSSSTASSTSATLLSYEKSTNQTWLTFHNNQSLIPNSTYLPKASGRLDLLALAVEHATF